MNPDGAFCEMSYIRKKDSVIKKHENKNAAKLKTFQSPEKHVMFRS